MRLDRILKSKADLKKSADELIAAYLTSAKEIAADSTRTMLSDLLIFLDRHYATITPDAALSIIESKVDELDLLPKDPIAPIYEKALSEGVAASFGAADYEAIKATESRLLWVAGDSRERTKNELRKILREAFEGRHTKEEFFDRLRSSFDAYANTEPNRLKSAADWHLRQNQNIAVVNRAVKSGTAYLRVRAKMDAHTTNICRSMHGRLIPIAHIKRQVEGILSATTVSEAVSWSDTSREKEGLFAKKLPANIGLPPYHFGCRTMVEEVPASVMASLQTDQFGRAYTFDDGIDRRKAQAALKRITREGHHPENADTRILQGENGAVLSIDRNNRVTALGRAYEAETYYEAKK